MELACAVRVYRMRAQMLLLLLPLPALLNDVSSRRDFVSAAWRQMAPCVQDRLASVRHLSVEWRKVQLLSFGLRSK